ncbi:UDP-N-acetylmuramoyl-L-alanine--D-glutamate ligase [Patescibacteria group bacterium]|nr:UDP-N-acetylmuramoyl-L-alanine--D-glutamate ligase [Patescibacteria group bacterium]MBU4162167.1 UDP-N-acetylmuramoyl-L-alanine--D-glutamate ligase [Patescibacteria group bacterium]
MKLTQLENKKILILGLGREGESSFKFLRKIFPDKIIGLADKLEFRELSKTLKRKIKKDENTKLHLGNNYLKSIGDYDVIIKTPGISRKIFAPYISNNQTIASQTDIFLQNYSKQTIGVTATKGKGTTVSLLYKIFEESNHEAELIGNIGKPVLNYFKDGKSKKTFIFEISSHQLEDIKVSPYIAIFLNIHEGHLDYYKDTEEYFAAKKNITLWQKKNDFFIFNSDSPRLKTLAEKTKARKITFGKDDSNDCYFNQEAIFYQGKKVTKVKDIHLQGEHFIYDIMSAICAARLFNIPFSKIKKSISDYRTQKHCLQKIGKFKEIIFYDDSFATEPIAAISAIKAINPQTIILGGHERGLNFSSLAKIIIKHRIKTIIVFPPAGKRIKQAIMETMGETDEKPKFILVDNMRDAVKACYQHTARKGICALSPGCASFGIFKDYKDRGDQFQKFVKQFAK